MTKQGKTEVGFCCYWRTDVYSISLWTWDNQQPPNNLHTDGIGFTYHCI